MKDKQSKSVRQFRLHQVAHFHDLGYSQKEICQLVQLDSGYVSRIVRKYKSGGLEALRIKSAPGGQSRLSESDLAKLPELLSKGAIFWGYEGEIWTRARVKKLIEESFGVSYSVRQVGNILAKIGYSPQKPQRKDYRRSEQKAAQWKQEILPTLKKK